MVQNHCYFKGNRKFVVRNGADLIIKKGKKKYVYCSVLIDRLKSIDTGEAIVLSQRFYRLAKTCLNTVNIYGIKALDLNNQVKEGMNSSISVEVLTEEGEDEIVTL